MPATESFNNQIYQENSMAKKTESSNTFTAEVHEEFSCENCSKRKKKRGEKEYLYYMLSRAYEPSIVLSLGVHRQNSAVLSLSALFLSLSAFLERINRRVNSERFF